MSQPVTIRIDKPLDGETVEHGAVVEVRAIDRARGSRFVERVSVPVGEDATYTRAIDLEPGRYEFTAVLPSGSVLSEMVEVGVAGPPIHVTLRAETSPHEWLAWQQWSGNVSERVSVASLKTNLERAPTSVRTALENVTVDFRRPAIAYGMGAPDPVWQSLAKAFSELDVGEAVDPVTLFPPDYLKESLQLLRDPPYIAVRLPRGIGAGPGRAYIVVRRNQRSMLCAMPWPWQQTGQGGGEEALVEAVIAIEEEFIESPGAYLTAPDVDAPSADAVWSVRPTVRDRVMAGILAYFAAGEQTAARELVRPARELLFEKMINPFGAAGGAYILVDDWIRASSVGADATGSDKPLDWMRWIGNLSHSFPWLPDGAILEGWLALRSRDQEPRLDAARTALLEAERRGIPVYTAGVRRLVDGLLVLSGEMRRQGTSDPEIEMALARARRLAWQIDSRQPFTCVRLWSG